MLGCVGIGAHVQLAPIGAVPQRGPDLLAVDHELVAVQRRAGAQRREVGTRFRLRHALTPDVVGADHAGEQLALLGIGAVLHDRRCDVVHPDHIERHRRSGVNRLLGVSELFEHAGPAAAVLLRPGHRAPARVGHVASHARSSSKVPGRGRVGDRRPPPLRSGSLPTTHAVPCGTVRPPLGMRSPRCPVGLVLSWFLYNFRI